jgi:hypothetical protein
LPWWVRVCVPPPPPTYTHPPTHPHPPPTTTTTTTTHPPIHPPTHHHPPKTHPPCNQNQNQKKTTQPQAAKESAELKDLESAAAAGSREAAEEADRKRARSRSKTGNRSRSASRVAPRDVSGMPKDTEVRKKTEKLRKRQQLVGLGRNAKKGEGDRVHADMMPKWLNSGKTSLGTRDWR